MSAALNATHDPELRSWLASANLPGADFPVQNLPFGVFRRRGAAESFRGGVAIGDQVLDLSALSALGVLRGPAARYLEAAAQATLNQLMSSGPQAWSGLRAALSDLLTDTAVESALRPCLVPQVDVEHAVPATIGDYTDFYTSIHHATAVGRLFRPDNPLTPNYQWVPIGYHGRSSSISVSGQSFLRPWGQTMLAGTAQPTVAPSKRLDCELELGVYVGVGNDAGTPIRIADAEDHVFGLCLLNDWSARDLQAWEYQPLGPFLSKSFATTISPWIVTLEALAPFRLPFRRSPGEPAPLPYLDSAANRAHGALDIHLELQIQTQSMRGAGIAPQSLTRTSYRHAYWTVAQMLSHHTINGCNLRPGDLLGTGTQSGPTRAESGSLLELTEGGRLPFQVGGTESRTFFEDGDVARMRAWCERVGTRGIGFGDLWAEVRPAVVDPYDPEPKVA